MVSAMKKIISTIMLLAASAAAFISCDKQNTVTTPSAEESVFVFTSEKPSFDDDVKTEWNEAENTVYWSYGDKIKMAYTITPDGGDPIWQGREGANSAEDEPRLYASSGLANSSLTASFTVPGSFNETSESPFLETGQYVFYTLYPSDCCSGTEFSAKGDGIVNIEIPATQSISKNSFDSKADIMVGKSVNEYDKLPTESVPVMWNRVVAHAYITLKDINNAVAGEIVNTITLTAQDGAQLVGNYTVDLTDGALESRSGGDAKNILNVKVDNKIATLTDNDFSFWASIKPCTLTSLKVVIDTDKATYTRVIDLTGKEKTFLKNRRNLLRIDMSTAAREAKVVSDVFYTKVTSVSQITTSGQYILVYDQGATGMVATSISSKKINAVSVNYITDKGYRESDVNDYVVKFEDAGDGYYYIKVADNYVVYSGSSADLKNNITSSSGENTYKWQIDIEDGNVIISNVQDKDRYIMYSITNICFKAYKSDKKPQLYILNN